MNQKSLNITSCGMLEFPARMQHSYSYFIGMGRQAYTTIVRVTYGLNVASDDDELISIFAETLHRIVLEGVPGVAPLDLFPFCEFRINKRHVKEF